MSSSVAERPEENFFQWKEEEMQVGQAVYNKWVWHPLYEFMQMDCKYSFDSLDKTGNAREPVAVKYLRHILMTRYVSVLGDVATEMHHHSGELWNVVLPGVLGEEKEESSSEDLNVQVGLVANRLQHSKLSTLIELAHNGEPIFAQLEYFFPRTVDEFISNVHAKEFVLMWAREYFSPTSDVAQAIELIAETEHKHALYGMPLKSFMAQPLAKHPFAVKNQPITIGSVLSRMIWELRLYPTWILELVGTKFRPLVIENLENLRKLYFKHNMYHSFIDGKPMALPLPFGMTRKAKLIHGKYRHDKGKTLILEERILNEKQETILRTLQRHYRSSFCEPALAQSLESKAWDQMLGEDDDDSTTKVDQNSAAEHSEDAEHGLRALDDLFGSEDDAEHRPARRPAKRMSKRQRCA